MVKKPFSVRIEPYESNRFRALATVLNLDGAKLLSELITLKEEKLSKEEKEAYDSLLKLWKDKELR
ncbi:hypothetical protein OEV98_03940 [Caldibacillus lycopersici]|uniref:Uncharacterized protein n=1 Tax=Perspicuibacillus lycopersici TaxID=1325689 RepID=A0AAE3LM96_9BACI|nr:hypothetical protein [Perspicuibacillus lycopersici]MCU9612716.1 hypothetical protein [Perspicuibacillus lycopersici]